MKITIDIVSFWIVCGLLGWFIPLSCAEPPPPEQCPILFLVDLHNQDLSTVNTVGNYSLFEIWQPGDYEIYTVAIFDSNDTEESFTYIMYDSLERPAFVVDANFIDGIGTRYYVVHDDTAFAHNQFNRVYSGTYRLEVGVYRLEPDHYANLNPNVPPLNTVRVNWATFELKIE